jgi:hypothetical protein
MDAGAADPDLFSMSTGQTVERLRDAADAGAAMHVFDTEGKSCHGDRMRLTPNRR